MKLPADLFHQLDIHLVVQKAVNFQNITGLDDTVSYDSLFQKIHISTSMNGDIIAQPCRNVSYFLRNDAEIYAYR